jgi:hypothetical protein
MFDVESRIFADHLRIPARSSVNVAHFCCDADIVEKHNAGYYAGCITVEEGGFSRPYRSS